MNWIFNVQFLTEKEINQFVLKINQVFLTEFCYDFQTVFKFF